jgi:hypothetical protein
VTSSGARTRPSGGGLRRRGGEPRSAALPSRPSMPSSPSSPSRAEAGSLSLESVLLLPVVALLVLGLLGAVGIVRDVLVLHEAARAGARVAATTTGTEPVIRAAREAAPELPGLRVVVTPSTRRDGDLARVRVELERRLGPVTHRLRASTVARVEPAVGVGAGP